MHRNFSKDEQTTSSVGNLLQKLKKILFRAENTVFIVFDAMHKGKSHTSARPKGKI